MSMGSIDLPFELSITVSDSIFYDNKKYLFFGTVLLYEMSYSTVYLIKDS